MTDPSAHPPRDPERPAEGGAAPDRNAGELHDRLQRLNVALDKARPKGQAQAPSSRSDAKTASGMALAFRLGAEFVSAVLVGAVIGWGFDSVLGVAPLGMIVFMLIGFAAGVLNMLRAAGEMGRRKG